ncbi:EAL domain-containing protein [Methylomonas sp. LL1]|uniref:EAL domain-containing protein n=1 Tax=Methylomonas sp. LL1 TaxID=2785785 RepID=UPI001E5A2B0C|nr:EAL domain-containing protein [Methylomonas sp. LL1]
MYGTEIIRAAQIACNEINQSGGVLGKSLELIVEDDGSQPATAVPAALRLVNSHHCVAMIGNLLSNSRIAVANQVAERLKIPYLNFSFYEGSIAGRYFFHFAALPNQQIEKMIPAMAQRFGLKMFFAGSNYEWPRGSIDAAKQALSRLDGDVVGEEYLPINADSLQIEQLLQQLARSGADVFVPYFAGADQIALLNRFSAMGLKQRMAVVMGHYDETLAQQLLPEVREGFYSSNTYFMSLDTPQNHFYLQQLATMPGVNGIWPHGNGVVTNFSEATYLCVRAFAEAAQKAGSTDAEALVEALEHSSVLAPQGWVQMDAKTHHACVNTFLARSNRDGGFSIIERFGNNPPQIPKRYKSQIQESQQISVSSTLLEQVKAEAEASLRKMNTAHQILSIADMAILSTDENGTIQQANPNACAMFGYSGEEMRGMSVHLLVPPHIRQRHAEMVRGFVQGSETELPMSRRNEVMGYRKDGSFFPVEASIGKFHNGEQWMLVATMRDISEQKRNQADLLWQATHDALTGLANRNLIRERLDHALQRSRRQGLSLALLFVDLDGFKLINDTYGHETGDGLLKTMANRLIDMVRPGDTVARLSGDEFVIMCEQLEQPTLISQLAERINQAMRQPVECNGQVLYTSASIGIAVGHGSTHSTDDLLRSADTAMYEVKQQGRDGWHFFSSSLEEKVKRKLSITLGLRLAIERQELSVRFQPIVDADNNRIMGAELLLRWHPAEGEISPGIFIPIAEMTGSIVPIGAWVFAQACRAEAEWRRRWGEQAPAYISVNVSARQLNEESLIGDILRTISYYDADPSRILLEVTETSLMADIETNLRVLRSLANMGFRVAVDDFGTGYSSMAQLTRLPVNVLKIDRAFVDGIEKQPESRAVVRAIIGLGRALGLKMVAEGVENRSQLLELRNFGCHYIQGYLFYRPLEEVQFVEAVEQSLKNAETTPEPPLFFLLYSSQATPALDKNQIPELLKQTRSANSSKGITGCLLHQQGYFMQYLEGERTKVLNLLELIKKDPRHCNLTIIMQGNEYHRIFPEWSMGFRDVNQNIDKIDFPSQPKRQFSLAELAEDPRTSYIYITSFRENGLDKRYLGEA